MVKTLEILPWAKVVIPDRPNMKDISDYVAMEEISTNL